jgi:hypothetical protein
MAFKNINWPALLSKNPPSTVSIPHTSLLLQVLANLFADTDARLSTFHISYYLSISFSYIHSIRCDMNCSICTQSQFSMEFSLDKLTFIVHTSLHEYFLLFMLLVVVASRCTSRRVYSLAFMLLLSLILLLSPMLTISRRSMRRMNGHGWREPRPVKTDRW